MEMVVREPAVAGAFYPGTPEAVEALVDRCFATARHPAVTGEVIALVCPHAGYIYSGAAAASAWLALPQGQGRDCLVLVGPNHTGLGSAVSIAAADAWRVAGVLYPVDRELARHLCSLVPGASRDDGAHLMEHSLEVQLPFAARRLAPGFSILPVCLGVRPDEFGLQLCLELGDALARCLEGRSALIVASTDMSHYLSDAAARREDEPAIQAVLRMDPEGLVRVVRDRRITMCGVMPTAAVLRAAAGLGAQRAHLADYRTSAEASGDYDRVVSYASFVLTDGES
ncbi:MAG: MEMO1 family protein [Armatimonadota bacterium]|nr:MAG: MEMO1 family protein [Armatimonadota bacterium]